MEMKLINVTHWSLRKETPVEEEGGESFTWDPGVVASVADLISLMSTETQDDSDLGLL